MPAPPCARLLASRRHPGPIGLDIETTPLPQYRREREPVRLNKDGCAGSKPLAPRRRRGRIECSMQATGLLQGIGNRSLADAAGAFLGLEVSKDVRQSDWGAARLPRGQIAYAALDAVLVYRLWPLLDEQMTAKGRKGAYELPQLAQIAGSGAGTSVG
jgi:hypothetical protein